MQRRKKAKKISKKRSKKTSVKKSVPVEVSPPAASPGFSSFEKKPSQVKKEPFILSEGDYLFSETQSECSIFGFKIGLSGKVHVSRKDVANITIGLCRQCKSTDVGPLVIEDVHPYDHNTDVMLRYKCNQCQTTFFSYQTRDRVIVLHP